MAEILHGLTGPISMDNKENIPTPHNEAKYGEIAKTVLMPGDPVRAKFIADTYLENPRLVNDVRGVHGYTGKYKGHEITVMASGMGMPSIGIYSWELYGFYDVNNIIRVGTAGGYAEDLEIADIVAGIGACTDSNYAHQFGIDGTLAPTADYDLLSLAVESARRRNKRIKVGNFVSADHYYNDEAEKWKKMSVIAVEMEAAALYLNAMYFGKRALALCAISDHLFKSLTTTAEQRVTMFTDLMEVALDTAEAISIFDEKNGNR